MTKKILTPFCLLFIVVSLTVLFRTESAQAAPSICFNSTGQTNCPSGGTFTDSSGNQITGSLPEDRCYVQNSGGQWGETSCNGARAIYCGSSGGTWIGPTDSTPGATLCTCPTGEQLVNAVCITPSDPTNPGGGAPITRDDGFVERETYDCGDENNEQANSDQCLSENPIVLQIERAINFISAGIGLVVTIMFVVGGVQYASSGGNPQAVGAAKKKITNAIIALLSFIFMWAFLMWLVPGGIL